MPFSSFHEEFSAENGISGSAVLLPVLAVCIQPEQLIRQSLAAPALILDFILDENLDIGGMPAGAGSWRIDRYPAGSRAVIGRGRSGGYLISFIVQETLFPDWWLHWPRHGGQVSVALLRMILHILSVSGRPAETQAVRMDAYIQGLLALLRQPDAKKSPVPFSDLLLIYDIVLWLEGHPGNPPGPDDLLRLSGLTKSRFRKGFQALYGMPPRKMLRQIGMQRIYARWITQQEDFSAISRAFGYRHASNLATAFRDHFGFTPSALARQDPAGSRFSGWHSANNRFSF